MYIPDYYEFCCPVNIVAGHDALERIPGLLEDLGANSPMIVTDKGVLAAGLTTVLIRALSGRLSLPVIRDEVPPDSDLETVNRLAQVFREKNCDSIIALGGGSVLDTAKGVNILVSENADDITKFKGAGALKRKLNPLIAVPTTAGTGSEVTLVAVIADKAHDRKLLFTSYFLLPDAAVVDSRMTLTLPPHITAPTAMDALCHAMEACFCLGRNPISDAFAHEAISLICGNLMAVMENPKDRDGRLALATAATLAGMAFSNSMVGMVHGLGHSVGSVCHVPHGTCMAVLLPYGMEYNLHRQGQRIGELLLPMAGPETYARTPEHKRPAQVIEGIRRLNRKLSKATDGLHPTCLKEIRDRSGTPLVPRDKLPEIARTALGDGTLFYNPEELDYDDFLMVATAAWEGIPLDPSNIKKG